MNTRVNKGARMAGFDKVVKTYDEALAGLTDNMLLMVGGFGLCGIPENLIKNISVPSII